MLCRHLPWLPLEPSRNTSQEKPHEARFLAERMALLALNPNNVAWSSGHSQFHPDDLGMEHHRVDEWARQRSHDARHVLCQLRALLDRHC